MVLGCDENIALSIVKAHTTSQFRNCDTSLRLADQDLISRPKSIQGQASCTRTMLAQAKHDRPWTILGPSRSQIVDDLASVSCGYGVIRSKQMCIDWLACCGCSREAF